MGAKAASVFNNEGNKDVGDPVNHNDGLSGRPVNIQFAVLRFFSGVARYISLMWECGV